MSGRFYSLTEGQRAVVMRLIAEVHYRNGKRQPDGSRGTIKCSPGRLRELLAEAITYKTEGEKDEKKT